MPADERERTGSADAHTTAHTISLRITREFDAPRELIWQAWTQREHLMHWLCPKDFQVLFAEVDLRVGGAWRSGMRGPDGHEYIAGGTYQQIDKPHRLVFTHQWEQNIQEPISDTTVTVTLEESARGTTMTFEQVGFVTAETRDSHHTGWSEAFDNLAGHLESAADAPADREIVITRDFNAPQRLLWEAHAQPEHIAAWQGPRGFSTRVERHEFRVGGAWRYVMIGPDGTEYPSEGVFREIVPCERLATTDEFAEDFKHPEVDELPAGMSQTLIFEARGHNRTRLTVRITHPSAEERRKHEAMGVKAGYASMLDCLDEHLTRMANS